MKQYVIDQLEERAYWSLKERLDKDLESTMMEGIYWADLPEHLYTELQRQHQSCQPYYFAVNLSFRQIGFELLIRSRETLHCPCMAYANAEQMKFIVQYAEALLEDLKIRA